jgi:hypothetical protein
MRAEEKAKELFDTIYKLNHTAWYDVAKQCALIAVDEIINSNPCDEGTDRGGIFEWCSNDYYWQEVKREIEKL